MTTRRDIHNSDVPVVCVSCEARHKGICGALNPEQLGRLAGHTTRTAFPREIELQDTVHDEGIYGNILSGVVKLSKLMSDGRQQIVGLQFAPDFMGRPLTEDNSISIETATEVRLCSFPKKVIEEMLAESPELEHRLHKQTVEELDEARDWLLTLGRKTAAEKVASFLLLIANHIDPERLDGEDRNTITMELPLKRADIADFLGLTTETISRQLTNLRKRGVIVIEDRRTIQVPDMAALKRASEQDLSKN